MHAICSEKYYLTDTIKHNTGVKSIFNLPIGRTRLRSSAHCCELLGTQGTFNPYLSNEGQHDLTWIFYNSRQYSILGVKSPDKCLNLGYQKQVWCQARAKKDVTDWSLSPLNLIAEENGLKMRPGHFSPLIIQVS